jgi:hypothetical protein
MKKSNLLQEANPAVGTPFNAGPGSCGCVEPGPDSCRYIQTIFPTGAAYYTLQDEVVL